MQTIALAHVPLIPPAPAESPFHAITTLPLGDQMTEALAITDGVMELGARGAPYDVNETLKFFPERLNAQANMLAARHITPVTLATQRLDKALGYEQYADGTGLPSTTFSGYGALVTSDTPLLVALVESGLMSRDPARALLSAAIECCRGKQWDLRKYAATHLGEVRSAYLLKCEMDSDPEELVSNYLDHVSFGFKAGDPHSLRHTPEPPLVTPIESFEVQDVPFHIVLKGLLWLLDGSYEKNAGALSQHSAEALLARFDELAVEEGGPKLRRKRVGETWKRIQDRAREGAARV